jgi:hypothetical protein
MKCSPLRSTPWTSKFANGLLLVGDPGTEILEREIFLLRLRFEGPPGREFVGEGLELADRSLDSRYD